MIDALHVAALVEFESRSEHSSPDRPPLSIFRAGRQSGGDGEGQLLANVVGALDDGEPVIVEADIGAQRQLRKQLVHVLEVVAHGVGGQTEFGGDVGDPQRGKVVTLDQADGRIEDFRSSLRLSIGPCHRFIISFSVRPLARHPTGGAFFSCTEKNIYHG